MAKKSSKGKGPRKERPVYTGPMETPADFSLEIDGKEFTPIRLAVKNEKGQFVKWVLAPSGAPEGVTREAWLDSCREGGNPFAAIRRCAPTSLGKGKGKTAWVDARAFPVVRFHKAMSKALAEHAGETMSPGLHTIGASGGLTMRWRPLTPSKVTVKELQGTIADLRAAMAKQAQELAAEKARSQSASVQGQQAPQAQAPTRQAVQTGGK